MANLGRQRSDGSNRDDEHYQRGQRLDQGRRREGGGERAVRFRDEQGEELRGREDLGGYYGERIGQGELEMQGGMGREREREFGERDYGRGEMYGGQVGGGQYGGGYGGGQGLYGGGQGQGQYGGGQRQGQYGGGQSQYGGGQGQYGGGWQGQYGGQGQYGQSGGRFGGGELGREQGGMIGGGREMSGWRGGEGRQQGREQRQSFRGKGPVGYQRSDERIKELVCERLSDDHEVDASRIEIGVSNGEVTLSGIVPDKRTKRMAEDCVEDCPGVREVQNQLRVQRGEEQEPGKVGGTSGTTGTRRRETAQS
jgi:osmotically-inducible protein OsmY